MAEGIVVRRGGSPFIYEATLSKISKDYVVQLNVAKNYKIYCTAYSGGNFAYWEYNITQGALSEVAKNGNYTGYYFAPTIDGAGNLKPFKENGTPSFCKLLIVGV